jgi:hypothetical protein
VEDFKDRSDEDVLSDLKHARKHEGLCILPLRSTSAASPCEWTAFLRRLVRSTSEHMRFASSLTSKRILCLERPYATCPSRCEKM